MTTLDVIAVSIARARPIGELHGETVMSGIDKHTIRDDVFVRKLGIEGDEQADLSVHGGVDKAVYAYPSEHWSWWEASKGLACRSATFGENLTLSGADEEGVAIGDRFRWGDALLEVSQPRAPCFKLAMHTRRPDVPREMTLSARCGWYLRVIEEGRAPARNATLMRTGGAPGPSVRDAFRALFDGKASMQLRVDLVNTPALAESWRSAVARKILV